MIKWAGWLLLAFFYAGLFFHAGMEYKAIECASYWYKGWVIPIERSIFGFDKVVCE